ncbi:30S ribosomal protein S3 [bacterium]|nr:30S ribosomal protein S3 [bacterium]
MAQSTSPHSFRLGIKKNWSSRWLNLKNTPQLLEEDYKIRKFILKRDKELRIENVEIERQGNSIKIIIRTARPGLLIGRKGKGIELLKKGINKILKNKYQVNLSVEEIKHPETSAQIMAQSAAEDIERRISYRRVMKRYLSRIMQHKEVLGAKIMISGRLDGNEIARDEWLREGKLPLSTLRANIDYGFAEAHCTYGTIGIKIWIYKKED